MFFFLFALFILILSIVGLRKINRSWEEIILLSIYIISLFIHGFGFIMHDADYNVAIDPIENCYTPLASNHFLSILVFILLYQIALLIIWLRGTKAPPLLVVFSMAILLIGLILNGVFLIQIATHDKSSLYLNQLSTGNDDGQLLFIPAIIMSIVLGILMLRKVIIQERNKSLHREFKNQFLQRCNEYIITHYHPLTWGFLLIIPVVLFVTLVLILFGQDYNSLVKVFTDTTTWTFSQKMHPPPLDHRGHYLCTVAARGNPKIVQPIKVGKRHGKPIIVNRQLQIANAFEELIYDISPRIHYFIRSKYDKYGYNLSKKINTPISSNITYIVMKPLEWFFLLTLYFFVINPEDKIKKQYI